MMVNLECMRLSICVFRQMNDLGAGSSMEKLRIVIADDESIIRMDIREMLTEAGHMVVGEASNGRETLELVRKECPDLVIMDINMPEMDGITSAKLIGKEKLAPVLLLTAYSQQDIVEKAVQTGATGYLVKPVEEANLFPAIAGARTRWLDMQRLREDADKVEKDLEARKNVDRAKGILMDLLGITENDAYTRLRKYSMKKRISMESAAEAVIRDAQHRKNGGQHHGNGSKA